MSRRDDLNAALSKVDKRTKIMIGVLLLIIVAGAGYFALKPSSSSSSTAISVPTHHVVVKPKATVAPKVTPAPNNLPVQADPERDPFAPLPIEAQASDTAATVAATTTTATGGSGTSAPTPTPTPTPSATNTLQLISITGTTATVVYNNSANNQDVKAGGTIATGVVCIKITDDSIFVTYNGKAYAVAPGQTVSLG